MTNYYNEFDPFAAEWLRALIKKGLIPDGEVDTRSITDVLPADLSGFDQCHFFAGIGGWLHALRLAGWPDDRQIWTGSCPCQPFSVAGKGKGKEDERHLWPVFFELIRQVRPPVVMGEQVAGKAGYGWFDGVASDLEGEGYASRAVDIPACAVNAPHIRQRLYWVATNMENARDDRAGRFTGSFADEGRRSVDAGTESLRRTDGSRLSGGFDARNNGGCAVGDTNAVRELQSQGIIRDERRWISDAGAGDMGNANSRDENTQPRVQERERSKPGRGGGRFIAGDMADAADGGSQKSIYRMGEGIPETCRERSSQTNGIEGSGPEIIGDMADSDSKSIRGWRPEEAIGETRSHEGEAQQWKRIWPDVGADGNSFWDDTEWLAGADGKTRRAKPGICLLAHGVSNRVGRLRGYGNAIVPPLAAEVIKSFMETQ